MNIAIVDDEIKDIEQISGILAEYASLNLSGVRIDRYNNPERFLSNYTAYRYTVIFLDIYMQKMTGMDVAAKIRQVDREATIVFLTTSQDHMPEAFSLHAFDYLLKPANRDRIFRMMDDITHRATSDEKCFTFIEKKTEYSLRFNEIMVVRSNSHYLQVIAKDMKEYKTRMNFGDAESFLSEDGRFLTINRGMMVNMDFITDFSNGVCMINKTIYLPYNVKKHKELEQIYRNYIFSKLRQNSSKG